MTFHVSFPPALQPPPRPLPVRCISYTASAAWVRLAPCAMRFTTTYLFQSHSGGRWKSCGIGSYWWSSTKAIRQQWDQRNQPWRGFETFGSSRLSESNLNRFWTCHVLPFSKWSQNIPCCRSSLTHSHVDLFGPPPFGGVVPNKAYYLYYPVFTHIDLYIIKRWFGART
jgi:hypothetical protein